MKAIVQDNYGSIDDVLTLGEVDAPEPSDGEVLVRIRAASVNQQDCHVVTGIPYVVRAAGYGLTRPKVRIRGTDVAGTVEAVGAKVTQAAVGDDVIGWCDGAFAEYGCAPEQQWVPKPDGMSFESAGCLGVAAFTALKGVRDMGTVSDRRAGARERSVGRRGLVRGDDREVDGRGGDRRL